MTKQTLVEYRNQSYISVHGQYPMNVLDKDLECFSMGLGCDPIVEGALWQRIKISKRNSLSLQSIICNLLSL